MRKLDAKTQGELDEKALTAGAKIKVQIGGPEEEFTNSDREMFMLGFGAGRVDVLRELSELSGAVG